MNQPKELKKEEYQLIKSIAYHIKKRLPDSIKVEELIQEGYKGFEKAVNNMDEERMVTFNAYASAKVKGAILDYLRKLDYLSRGAREKANEMEKAINTLTQKLCRPPSHEELCNYLNLTSEELHNIQREIQPAVMQGSVNENEDLFGDVSELSHKYIDVETNLLNDDFYNSILKYINNLPPKDSLIFSMLHKEDLSLKEVSQLLGVSDSRVSQINAKIIKEIVEKMRNNF